MVRRVLAFLLAAMLLHCVAVAEYDDFGFEFSDDGYTGVWTKIDALEIEFCLPDGWTPGISEGGAAFTATSSDQKVTLSVHQEQEGVDDLIAWGESNLDDYRVSDASFYQALIVERPENLTLRFICNADQLIAFEFERTDADAISLDFALEIAGSTYESWMDESFSRDTGDGGDVDFSELFEYDTMLSRPACRI